MDRCSLQQIGMLQRGDRIHIQGCIPPGVRQQEGIIVVQVCEFFVCSFISLPQLTFPTKFHAFRHLD